MGLILLSAVTAICQPVSCIKTLTSVKNYITKNYVGFADKVTPATQKAYQAHTNRALAYAKLAQSKSDCYFVIDYWLSYFKDHHIYIQIPPDTANVEKIQVSEKQITRLADSNALAVEGIYYTRDSVYKAAVIKSNKGLRSYAGVILESHTPQWKPGQVKFELIKTGMNEYQGTWYLRNHSAYISRVRFDQQNGLASEGWVKQNAPVQSETVTPLFEEEQQVNAFFKILNDSTGYVRIKSFDLFYARGIDSVIRANLGNIQSMSRLIIDLRNNGGGGDHAMLYLKPLIYSNPVTNIGVDLMVTPDNIAAWEDAINKYRNVIPKKELDHVQQVLDQGRGKQRALVNFEADHTDTLPALDLPARIAIVIDHGCASATEEFLLYAKQSKKVVMAGEPSSGVLDYSNVVHKEFYSPDFILGYPTTRSRRIDVGLGIDNVGIQPDIPLDLSKNTWLNELLIRF